MNSAISAGKIAANADVSTPLIAAGILDAAITRCSGHTLFTDEAVNKYKDAAQRNAVDAAPKWDRRLYRYFRDVNFVYVLAQVVLALAFIVICASMLTGLVGTVIVPLYWGATTYYGFLADTILCLMWGITVFTLSFWLASYLERILPNLDALNWSIIKPDARVPENGKLIMAQLTRELKSHGKVQFELHTMGVDPFLRVKLVHNETGTVASRFFFGWDRNHALTQTGNRIFKTDTYIWP